MYILLLIFIINHESHDRPNRCPENMEQSTPSVSYINQPRIDKYSSLINKLTQHNQHSTNKFKRLKDSFLKAKKQLNELHFDLETISKAINNVVHQDN